MMPSQGTTYSCACARCGAPTTASAWSMRRRLVIWCHDCAISDPDTKQAILNRTSIGPCGCCRVWDGYLTAQGYGIVAIKGHRYPVHRLLWEIVNGPIRDGRFVCHDCPCGVDRRECCEPSHMFLGTSRDNMQDAAKKGRTLTGERHPMVRLTEAQVREIRVLNADGETQRELAHRYGMSQTAIGKLIRKETWGHV